MRNLGYTNVIVKIHKGASSFLNGLFLTNGNVMVMAGI